MKLERRLGDVYSPALAYTLESEYDSNSPAFILLGTRMSQRSNRTFVEELADVLSSRRFNGGREPLDPYKAGPPSPHP